VGSNPTPSAKASPEAPHPWLVASSRMLDSGHVYVCRFRALDLRAKPYDLLCACKRGILIRMPESTSIRVAPSTRDAVRSLAEDDRVTLDEEIQRLTRAERQRRIGISLSTPIPPEDERWLDASSDSVTNHAGG